MLLPYKPKVIFYKRVTFLKIKSQLKNSLIVKICELFLKTFCRIERCSQRMKRYFEMHFARERKKSKLISNNIKILNN